MHRAPTTDIIVELLAPMWRDALGVEVTGASDFLALGGDSLAAVTIATAVAEHFEHMDGIDLVVLQAIFERPDLAGMAEVLRDFIDENAGA